jgi:hypothetical protein
MAAAPTPASNLQQLQQLYAQLLVNIAAAEASSAPNVAVDGVSIDRVGYLNNLYERLERLQKIPGVAQTPIFNHTSTAR